MDLQPKIIPISHATFVIEWDDIVIYNDPVDGVELFKGQTQADIVLISDIHRDHFDEATLRGVLGSSATLIVPQAVKNELSADLGDRAQVMNNGETLTERGFEITAIPMYNLPTADNANYHTKGRGNGYLIQKRRQTIYIAGDTAGTPEMRALKDVDVAFIPMNLPYTMSVEEAADAVLAFHPKVVYPYHYRGPDGLSDVATFEKLVHEANPEVQVVLGNWYPSK